MEASSICERTIDAVTDHTATDSPMQLPKPQSCGEYHVEHFEH